MHSILYRMQVVVCLGTLVYETLVIHFCFFTFSIILRVEVAAECGQENWDKTNLTLLTALLEILIYPSLLCLVQLGER